MSLRFSRDKQPLSLTDLAKVLRIPLSSCHDLVRAMQSRGYLYEVSPRAGYYPTLRLRNLGAEIAEGDPIVARASNVLSSVRDALDESVFLCKAQGFRATYLLVYEGKRLLRVMREAGDEIGPLHARSAGKALLSCLDDRELQAYLASSELTKFNERTITTTAELVEEIEFGRRRGWFMNNGESESDILSISAPLRWNSSIYIITIAAPLGRFAPRVEEAARLLTDARDILEKGTEPI
jgi:DNA-binding IclR family transcriptional regulator